MARAEQLNVLELLKQKSALVERELAHYLPAPAEAKSAELREYYEMMWDYPQRGGKRLRPAIIMLACEMFGGKTEDTLPTAVAMDLFQHWVLVHDDIEDQSDLRRGKPVLHKIYGIEKALNAGDGLTNYMWKALLANKPLVGATKAFRVLTEFAHQVEITAEGQAIELAWNMGNRWDMTEAEYLDMIAHKAVHYTTTTPLVLGAVLAGARARDLAVLRKVGLKSGYAFQITDDALNLYAEEAQYGKEIAGDIYEGKRTLILIHLLKHARKEDKARVLEIMAKPRAEKSEGEVREVLDLIKKYGSIEYAKKKALAYAEEALTLFRTKFTEVPGAQARDALANLIDYLATRDK